jgi:hypothetical protein
MYCADLKCSVLLFRLFYDSDLLTMMELQTCKILSSCFRCIAYVFLFIMCLPFICFKRLLCFELQICEIISRCFLFIMGLPFIFFKRLLCFLNDPECPSCEQKFPSWELFYKHVCPQQTGPQMLADILCYIDWCGATGYAEKNKRKKQIATKYKFQFGRLYDCSWVGALNAAKRLRTQLNRAYFESIFGTDCGCEAEDEAWKCAHLFVLKRLCNACQTRDRRLLDYYDITTPAGRQHRAEQGARADAYYDINTPAGRQHRAEQGARADAYWDDSTQAGRQHRAGRQRGRREGQGRRPST